MKYTVDPIVIIAANRTPIGAFLGQLKNLSAADLSALLLKKMLAKFSKDIQIDEAFIGNVLQAGQGQAPARQAILKAQLNNNIPCTTINKMCGSGMQALIQAYDSLHVNDNHIIIAGGQESMSNAPHLLPNMRQGTRFGHQKIYDHMFKDGLEDAYDGSLMGIFAEQTASDYNFSREDQDNFALSSLDKANEAIKNNLFVNEIENVEFNFKNKEFSVICDEIPLHINKDKIPHLKSAFIDNGTVTAANSSSLADGAAALIMTKLSIAEKLNIQPLAKVLGYAKHATLPNLFPIAPAMAIKKLLSKLNLSTEKIDLWEINEAFAVVTMAAIQDLSLAPSCVNVHGGACCLGHPIGASGARIIVTLLHALRQRQLSLGIASLCIGGGESLAVAIEIL